MNRTGLFLSSLFAFVFYLSGYASELKKIDIPEKTLKQGRGKTILAVIKKEYLIYVLDKQSKQILAQFPVALGINPGKKIIQGDNRTPEGIYWIHEILSADMPVQSKSYQTLKKMNSIEWKAADGHSKYGKPSEDLGKNAYGPRIFKLNYPNEEDRKLFLRLRKEKKLPAGARLGTWIGIHGTNDPDSIQKNASSGCIRLLNSDLILLGKYIEPGTLVVITSE